MMMMEAFSQLMLSCPSDSREQLHPHWRTLQDFAARARRLKIWTDKARVPRVVRRSVLKVVRDYQAAVLQELDKYLDATCLRQGHGWSLADLYGSVYLHHVRIDEALRFTDRLQGGGFNCLLDCVRHYLPSATAEVECLLWRIWCRHLCVFLSRGELLPESDLIFFVSSVQQLVEASIPKLWIDNSQAEMVLKTAGMMSNLTKQGVKLQLPSLEACPDPSSGREPVKQHIISCHALTLRAHFAWLDAEGVGVEGTLAALAGVFCLCDWSAWMEALDTFYTCPNAPWTNEINAAVEGAIALYVRPGARSIRFYRQHAVNPWADARVVVDWNLPVEVTLPEGCQGGTMEVRLLEASVFIAFEVASNVAVVWAHPLGEDPVVVEVCQCHRSLTTTPEIVSRVRTVIGEHASLTSSLQRWSGLSLRPSLLNMSVKVGDRVPVTWLVSAVPPSESFVLLLRYVGTAPSFKVALHPRFPVVPWIMSHGMCRQYERVVSWFLQLVAPHRFMQLTYRQVHMPLLKHPDTSEPTRTLLQRAAHLVWKVQQTVSTVMKLLIDDRIRENLEGMLHAVRRGLAEPEISQSDIVEIHQLFLTGVENALQLESPTVQEALQELSEVGRGRWAYAVRTAPDCAFPTDCRLYAGTAP
ncbi:MAG: hypothetical protein KVP17_001766 [Porospora cf. gigantea B]|uniref:uncharacterized protein n=1 Tax=Porospora cf. gigantea B TaxID=2853592 RepID=UPI003571ABBD|nr:MAG: hypothetical protein KVP17_001766 [Porospora cf. gigantea B]